MLLLLLLKVKFFFNFKKICSININIFILREIETLLVADDDDDVVVGIIGLHLPFSILMQLSFMQAQVSFSNPFSLFVLHFLLKPILPRYFFKCKQIIVNMFNVNFY